MKFIGKYGPWLIVVLIIMMLVGKHMINDDYEMAPGTRSFDRNTQLMPS